MASTPTVLADTGISEGRLLQKLLGLYAEERRVYGQVLELSRRQGEIVRNGGPLQDVRHLLEKKKGCLEIIARLERLEHGTKADWENRRHQFSAAGRERLRGALRQVADLIEQILACEESNDRDLIEQTRAV